MYFTRFLLVFLHFEVGFLVFFFQCGRGLDYLEDEVEGLVLRVEFYEVRFDSMFEDTDSGKNIAWEFLIGLG